VTIYARIHPRTETVLRIIHKRYDVTGKIDNLKGYFKMLGSNPRALDVKKGALENHTMYVNSLIPENAYCQLAV